MLVKQDNVQANLESVQCRVFQIWKVFDYKYCKSRSRDPFPTPFDLIFHFLSLVPPMVNLHAKFEVSSSNRSRDIEGVPKFQK